VKRNRGNREGRIERRERAEKCAARTAELAKRLRVRYEGPVVAGKRGLPRRG
jgi:hypothetical protein